MDLIRRIKDEYPTCNNTKRLARELGITLQKLHNTAYRLGLSRRRSKQDGFTESLERLLVLNLSNPRIASELNTSEYIVRYWRKKLGYRPHPSGAAGHVTR